nr:MAG TPA: PROTEIN/RNA Complex.7A [Caudoviricetes sp.]
MNNKFTRCLKCPWCNKGEALADGKAKVTISVQCGKCGRVFFGDLYTLKTERGVAQRRVGKR